MLDAQDSALSDADESSGWTALILALMYEMAQPTSPWQPYFEFVGPLEDLTHPHFWGEAELQRLLGGTGVPESVQSDVLMMEAEYEELAAPIINSHPDLFDANGMCC